MTPMRERMARAIENGPTLAFSYDQESSAFSVMATTWDGETIVIGSYLTQALAIAASRKWMCLALADAALSELSLPSEGMVEAGEAELNEQLEIGEVFTAMISAAREGK